MKAFKNICCALFLLACLFSCDAPRQELSKTADEKPGDKHTSQKKDSQEETSAAVSIVHKYKLPRILQEISGLAYLGKDQFACVQDESGVIFIYNTSTDKIERQISFGGTGDYEGLALVNGTAYVVRSDGTIFEVDNLDKRSPQVQVYQTSLTAANDVEGITFDRQGHRLLLAIKGKDAGPENVKSIYAFDLKTKKLSEKPAFQLNLADSVLTAGLNKKAWKPLQLSEIAVHPLTGDIYLTETSPPQLLIASPNGSLRARYKLSKQDFAQPEGLTFGPAGELYIANEGKQDRGNIVQVKIE